MNEQAVRAEPLDYYSAEQTSWRPVVRACAYVAGAQAILNLANLVSPFVIIYGSIRQRIFTDVQAVIGFGLELLVGIACVGVIVAASLCTRFLRGADRWMLRASASLVGAELLHGMIRSWAVLTEIWGGAVRVGPTGKIAYLAMIMTALAGSLLVPLLLIWLMRRPEARRQFGA